MPKYEPLEQQEESEPSGVPSGVPSGAKGAASSSPKAEEPSGGALAGGARREFLGSLKGLFDIMWPTSASFLLQQATQQATIMFVGHLGPLQLGAAAMGTMWFATPLQLHSTSNAWALARQLA